MRPRVLLTAMAAVLLGTASPAVARTINVRPGGPGENTIQRAIDRAEPGDSIRVHHGRYAGAIEIDKRLSIRAAQHERLPVIDARCREDVAVDVRARGVRVAGLSVEGASVDAVGLDRIPGPGNAFPDVESVIKVNNLTLLNSCGTARYGVDLRVGGRVTIEGNDARGFLRAGYRLAGIRSGPVFLLQNTATGNNIGAIVENSFPADGWGGDGWGFVSIMGNFFSGNTLEGEGPPTGFLLRSADDIGVVGNRANDNGAYGIHLDSRSDDNRIYSNHADRNGTANLLDEGTGNCGGGNSPPLPRC